MAKTRRTIAKPKSNGARSLTDALVERLRDERRVLAVAIPRVGQLADLFARSEVHDPEDASVQETDQHVVLDIIDRRSNRIALIDAALARVDEGTFGLCTSCDEPIASARLNADPSVPLCINCQRILEERGPLRVLEM